MPSGVRGNGFTKLRELRAKLAALSAEVFEEANEALAEAAGELVVKGLRGQHDAYGKPWKPTVDGGNAFIRNGMPAIEARHTGRGFAMSVKVPYGDKTHKKGRTIRGKRGNLRFQVGGRWVSKPSVKIPARPLFPEPSRGLGAEWRTAFHQRLDRVIRKHMGKR
jgi:hypothetical protein